MIYDHHRGALHDYNQTNRIYTTQKIVSLTIIVDDRYIKTKKNKKQKMYAKINAKRNDNESV